MSSHAINLKDEGLHIFEGMVGHCKKDNERSILSLPIMEVSWSTQSLGRLT